MVLNEATQRLGVSLRQTEDEITRNMLQSTASFINCVAGANGRVVAVLKPSLIDLEVLQQDDRAEGVSHRERLSEKDLNKVCDSLNTSIAA